MSYPPRPPMMSGMPPPVTYGFPMGMMSMPQVMPPNMMSHSLSMQKQPKKLIPQEIPQLRKKDHDGENKPVTTVFVGNIADRAPDPMVKQMLQRCGNVLSWKRVQGASGKLQAFGFCEYDDPESTWRCIRLLNEWQICEKKLVVKVDAKTKALLDEYKKKKRAKQSGKKADSENGNGEEGETEDDSLDEFTMREDRVAKAGLDAIMREYHDDLTRDPVAEEQNRRPRKQKEEKDTGIEDMDMEDDKKDLINREIKFFRDSHKVENDDNSQQQSQQQQSQQPQQHLRENRDFRDRERERRRREEREREYERERREREKERLRRERERTRSRSRSRERSSTRDRTMPATKTTRAQESLAKRERREKEAEEEEEMYERKKLERKLREKETAYQERLKVWEARERKKTREYEKEKEKEDERKFEEAKEGRRLREFLEDYDDERDDPKFYKGSALSRRLKEREKEIEADTRDRQREKEEIEEIRRKLLEEGHPDPEGEVARIEDERNEHLRPRLKLEHEPLVSETPKPVVDEPPPQVIPLEEVQQPDEEQMEQPRILPEGTLNLVGPMKDAESTSTDSPSEMPPRKKKMTVSEAFNQDDEEEAEAKRRKLTLPDSMDQSKPELPAKPPTSAEEKRKFIKTLIEQIPTGKEELFAYKMDWTMVDQSLMDKRIKPWVNKKIVEYIGEEEATLVEFICQKVIANSTPHNILDDVAMVLDEEAEVFVVKMWRLLIYETEAKKAGLVK
ncbi:RNA-binding protein 25-like isoform X2 [Tubulanus polymorphus]|uniref:RNA-binding protein 25-like isoform X2 n=1 Tax=Tubulanus polymorphus TaxID=672921 RepID=UPI003DA1E698